jgi:hypothetical protein
LSHPLVDQLRFTRTEFMRSLEGLSESDARKRLLPMNCVSWNIGHLAWQEQRYFLYYAQGLVPFPDIQQVFAYGAPASTPPLKQVLAAWHSITQLADPWLDRATSQVLSSQVVREGRPDRIIFGSLLLRTIYHYWYHTGENMAIRQALGHADLPEFVGDIDGHAPYRGENPA